jgi:hypothetical protein
MSTKKRAGRVGIMTTESAAPHHTPLAALSGAETIARAERAKRPNLAFLWILRALHPFRALQRKCAGPDAVATRSGLRAGGWIGVLAEKLGFRTANTENLQLSEFFTENAEDVSKIENGQWLTISPFGDFLRPDGSAVQRFHLDQAESVIRTWNSLTGVAARYFKNLFHGLGKKATCPIWDGHPDSDNKRYPVERLLGEITELRVTANSLQGRVQWNPKGLETRRKGSLYPSPLWWHFPPAGNPPAVFPEMLESVGLDPNPNIKGMPAWTANSADALASTILDPLASPEAESPTNGQITQNTMDRKEIAIALGLAETATEVEIRDALASLRTTANSGSALLSTANAQVGTLTTERDQAQTALTTANAQLAERNTTIGTLTTERDTLRTANASLVDGVLVVAEKHGIIAPADRDTLRGKLTSANSATTLTELAAAKPALNTRHIELNGNRLDITTANSRAEALSTVVAKRMADFKEDYDTAFAKVQKDPAMKPLFDAMQQPKTA